MLDLSKKYPRSISRNGMSIELSVFTAEDIDDVHQFACSLPEGDLQFLRIDITDRPTLERWADSVSKGQRYTILARRDGKLVGYGSLNRRELHWMRHLGEIRVIVSPEVRRIGLGALLASETFDIARDLGLTKIVAQMAREQQGARKMFQDLGFAAEALLADWVIDRDGKTRDMLIMSFDVTGLG
ncbi:MAG: GNAT family N-acetyltransferase [Acidobacteria bacterium]|nr:MAG: GNAT family N-acetyltransferase [Acidobacteriota bacterium]REK07638.1 MAG: GNAT family N-acetyltransferase [Acidobacteriota bacterium]